MSNPVKKIQRTSQIIAVLAKYGFKDIVSRLPWKSKITLDRAVINLEQISVYTRIRMALEELGPAFVKFGQAATTREGLLPKELVEEFKKLEDRVEPVEINVKKYIEEDLGILSTDFFEFIDTKPLAAASISQVYKGKLLNGDDVIIKIRRPNIADILLTDLALMKDLAKILDNNFATAANLNLSLIVDAFSKTLTEELSLTNEKLNIERFAKNFKDDNRIKVPKIYPQLCSDTILCMEYIHGVKITDETKLLSLGLDLKSVVKTGLNLYLEQILFHGFFHGDPHPGNILVLESGIIAFIDFGNMGSLLSSDKLQLEDFIMTSVEQDATSLGYILEDLAIYSKITDRKKYERTLNELFEIMTHVSIGEIDLQVVFNKVWDIIGQNVMHFPEYIYQLIRGISLLEGIGKKLDPTLNVLENIKPYASKMAMQRLNPDYLIKKGFRKMRGSLKDLEQLPDDLRVLLRQVKNGELLLSHNVKDFKTFNNNIKKGSSRLTLALLVLSLNILAGMLTLADISPKIFGLPILAFIFITIALVLSIYLIFSILRTK